ncbi:MAG: acyl-CoA dehydrogenase family protein [Vampirovibrionales bacterium]|nr:acyl-CoA dehydrogenase family protein [Vampirovibrionales bacterium]
MMSEIHLQLQALAQEVAHREILPRIKALESGDAQAFAEIWAALAEAGLCGLSCPEAYGGAGCDALSIALVMETLAAVNASVAVALSVHNTVGILPIVLAATPEQKQKYLPKLASGEWISAFALSEPEAGSDAAGSAHTTATQTPEGGFIVNGSKIFITNAQSASVFVITAKTAPGKLTAFIVERDTPGFNILPGEAKLGLRGSDWGELLFDRCELKPEHCLGELNQGFKLFLSCLDAGRISIAAISVGLIAASLSQSAQYACQREQFGRPIGQFGAIQEKLATMATDLEAARLMVYHAARLKDAGVAYTNAASQAKLFASEAAMRAATQAVQILGGYGYTTDFPVERIFRDAKAMTLIEGTSQVQRLVISRF